MLLMQLRTCDLRTFDVVCHTVNKSWNLGGNNSNGNWTKWSIIQGEIARIISKSEEHAARGRLRTLARLLSNLYDTRSNY